jgi:hypothetical protein
LLTLARRPARFARYSRLVPELTREVVEAIVLEAFGIIIVVVRLAHALRIFG